MERIWSKIDGYPNYSVSNYGEIRNDKSKTYKTPVEDTYGYYRVDLYNQGQRKTARVHRLVAESFIDNDNDKNQINHIDGDKTNNHVSNLEWTTAKENMEHAVNNRLFTASRGMLGKKNPNGGRQGTPIRIVETGETFTSTTACEKAIDGNSRHIYDCLHGIQHTHRGYHFEYA